MFERLSTIWFAGPWVREGNTSPSSRTLPKVVHSTAKSALGQIEVHANESGSMPATELNGRVRLSTIW